MTEGQKIRACLLGPVGTAMGTNWLNSEGSPRPVSLNFSSRVMLFCLDGVTHDGKSRQNRRKVVALNSPLAGFIWFSQTMFPRLLGC